MQVAFFISLTIPPQINTRGISCGDGMDSAPLVRTNKGWLRKGWKKKEKEKEVKRRDWLAHCWHGSWAGVTALEQISRETLKSAVSTILNCYPPITPSTDARSDRQLVRCIFSLIFHISPWHDIIPDDCLSVMVYDEKCWGLLMCDVSVYHFDGWPPW